MTDLKTTHPSTYEAFLARKFTAQRQTKYTLSATPCDQVMEQTLHRNSKTSGGIIGYTQNPNAVKRSILSQPERATISRKCEQRASLHDDTRMKRPKFD